MNITEIFAEELSYIKDEIIKDRTIKALESLPDYFIEIPASATGKYHPTYSLGYGGLVRHTKAAVKIANELLQLEQYNHLDGDAIIMALLLHDGFKQGDSYKNRTDKSHPIYAAEHVMNLEDFDHKEEVADMIRSHMGQWNTDDNGEVILPKPITDGEKFVHLCDYLASRKFINVEVV